MKTLEKKDYLYIGSMLFGIIFGAGNLIFPVHMGQEAGAKLWPATLGFLVSDIGLSFLAIVAMALAGHASVYDLAAKVGKTYALGFTVLLYLVLGPLFALPRLATTSFQIGLAPFIGEGQQGMALLLYSAGFFLIAWALSQKAEKLLAYVGKVLNPIFLLVLGILLVLTVLSPMGNSGAAPVQEAYQTNAFVKGFIEGYNTLDVVAALAYAIVIISTLKHLGVEEPKQIAKDMIKSGAVSMGLMVVIYVLLVYAGATSLGQFALSANGGIALAQIAGHYLGTAGNILLALIVFFGCLKTAVGLLTAFSETFAELFPKVSYQTFLLAATVFPAVFANVGLTKIISYAIPVLMFLYPLAIILVILALLDRFFQGKQSVYVWTTLMTFFPAVLDGLAASPWATSPLVADLLGLGQSLLPFASLGMGWLLPAFLGLLIGWFWPEKGQSPLTGPLGKG